MSIDKIHLWKLLRLFYAKPNLQRRLLLDEIRRESKESSDEENGGGDFHVPFWADAKAHVAGKLDLQEKSKIRARKNKSRARLYPLLARGFLSVWNEKIRWRNEEFEFHPKSIKGSLSLNELGATVKVENVLAVKIWDGTDRAIYPYFSEEPILSIEGVRLGFWALEEALSELRAKDLRILDVLRGSYFRPEDAPQRGDERNIFAQKYKLILEDWTRLREERNQQRE